MVPPMNTARIRHTGPSTLARPNMGHNCLWVDVPRAQTEAQMDREIERYLSMKLTTIYLVLNAGTGKLWNTTWKRGALARFTRRLLDAGLGVEWMVWPCATRAAIDGLAADLAERLDLARAEGVDTVNDLVIQFDAEGRSNRHGWGPAGENLAAYLEQALEVVPGMPRVWSITIIPPVAGVKKARPQDYALLKLKRVKIAIPQGYSKDDPGKAWDNIKLFHPILMQLHVAKTFLPFIQAGLVDQVVGGYFLIHQKWNVAGVPQGIKALEAAVGTYYGKGITAVAAWSRKLMGKRQPRERLVDFLASVPAILNHPDAMPNIRPEVQTSYPPAGPSLNIHKVIQQALSDQGYPLDVDGIWGGESTATLMDFEQARGLTPDGKPDLESVAHLLGLHMKTHGGT